ncbi:MAG: GcrA family cell cycle regulator [Pseudomonadota bacterium]
MAWNEERVELLKKLWAEGLSASQIAGKMGGVTRNAVIGKVHRLGLSGRATPAKPQRGRDLAHETTPVEPAAPTLRSAPTQPTHEAGSSEPEFIAPITLTSGDMTTVATLSRNMCKWPIGDPASDDFHFCGQQTEPGKSYCTHHANMAFQPSQKRADAQAAQRQLAAPAPQKRRAVG